MLEWRVHVMKRFLILIACLSSAAALRGDDPPSIEAKTRVHRLSTTNRSPYDAAAYVNRIPDKPRAGETPADFAGRVLGRLANQEGRILIKLPPGMDRQAYEGLKTFYRFANLDGEKLGVGNCAACHTPPEFTDFQSHVVASGGEPQPTPSLRNLGDDVDLQRALQTKLAAARQKQSGAADDIAEAYGKIQLSESDIDALVAFLQQLDDVEDAAFRTLILDSQLLTTAAEIE